jgi:uncharacterized protein DUF5658
MLNFVFLQLLDFLTTVVGLKWGAQEINPFIRYLMWMGPLEGLLACKILILLMGAIVLWYDRHRVILIVNYVFAVIVLWNVTQLLKIPVI